MLVDSGIEVKVANGGRVGDGENVVEIGIVVTVGTGKGVEDGGIVVIVFSVTAVPAGIVKNGEGEITVEGVAWEQAVPNRLVIRNTARRCFIFTVPPLRSAYSGQHLSS